MTLLADILAEVGAPVKPVNDRRLPKQPTAVSYQPYPMTNHTSPTPSRPVSAVPMTPPRSSMARPWPRKTAQTRVLFENPLDGDIFDDLSDNEETKPAMSKTQAPAPVAPLAPRCNCPPDNCAFPTHTTDEIPITINTKGQHIVTIKGTSYRVTMPIPPPPNARSIYINDAGNTVLDIDGFEYQITLPSTSSSDLGRPISYSHNGDKIVRINGAEYPVVLPGERMKPLPVVHNDGINLLPLGKQYLASPFADGPAVRACGSLGWKPPKVAKENSVPSSSQPMVAEKPAQLAGGSTAAKKRKAPVVAVDDDIVPKKKKVIGDDDGQRVTPKRGRPAAKPKAKVNKWIAAVQKGR